MHTKLAISTAMMVMGALADGGKDYDYIVNGEDWGPDLNPDYADCVNGTEQSPVDLSNSNANTVLNQ